MQVKELKKILSKYSDDTYIMLTQHGSAFDIEYIDESKVILKNDKVDYKDIKHLKNGGGDYIEDFVGEKFINIIV